MTTPLPHKADRHGYCLVPVRRTDPEPKFADEWNDHWCANTRPCPLHAQAAEDD